MDDRRPGGARPKPGGGPASSSAASAAGKPRISDSWSTSTERAAASCTVAAFRGAAVLGAGCAAAVRRHVERAGASVLAHGGYSPESSVLMQQLIDLHRMVAEIDVRDDHLCVEAGMRFTQEDLRASLISPIADIWEPVSYTHLTLPTNREV